MNVTFENTFVRSINKRPGLVGRATNQLSINSFKIKEVML